MTKIRVGLIGCGTISSAYLDAAPQFGIIEMVACADVVQAAADAQAAKYGLHAMTVDALLAHPDIDVVLNLTTPQYHVDIGALALRAGKHTYCEKPLALTVEQARTLVDLSQQTGLLVGCAPDTFLSGAHQTARRAIDAGQIGRPVSGTAFMMCPGHELWHPNPEFYYKTGGGPLMDMGPYYLTCLVDLLGPVDTVIGNAAKTYDTRTVASGDKAGETFGVDVPTHVSAILTFANGARVTMTTSFDVPLHDHPHVEIYGETGALSVGDPNQFQREVKLFTSGSDGWTTLTQDHLYGDMDYRIIGLVDMAHAIVGGRPPRASLALSLHVLEIMEGILQSADTGAALHLQHQCPRPAPISADWAFGQLD